MCDQEGDEGLLVFEGGTAELMRDSARLTSMGGLLIWSLPRLTSMGGLPIWSLPRLTSMGTRLTSIAPRLRDRIDRSIDRISRSILRLIDHEGAVCATAETYLTETRVATEQCREAIRGAAEESCGKSATTKVMRDCRLA